MKSLGFFLGILLVQNTAFGQSAPVVPTPAPPAVKAVDKNQLASQVIESLDIPKAVDAAVENSGKFFKMPPTDRDPAVQKKITELYAAALKDFEAQQSQLKSQVLQDIKSQILSNFTTEDLEYLVVLSKYPAYKKMQSFLASEKYTDILGKPFVKNRDVIVKLKKQVDDLKKASPVPSQK